MFRNDKVPRTADRKELREALEDAEEEALKNRHTCIVAETEIASTIDCAMSLCGEQALFGTMAQMSLPPFHGIFSASMDAAARALGGEEMNPVTGGAGFSQKAQEETKPVTVRSQPGQMALDVFEYDSYYIIKAPIAGIKLSDIDIEITDNVITIRGVRKQTDDVPADQYYLQECFWGEFSRSVTMPFMIDPKKVKATFNKECILKVLIPKEEKVKIVRVNE